MRIFEQGVDDDTDVVVIPLGTIVNFETGESITFAFTCNLTGRLT